MRTPALPMMQACTTLAVTLGLAIPLAAQSTGGLYRTITHITLLPGRADDYRAAIMEYNQILHKAGWDRRLTVYQSASGPQEFRVITARPKLADLETPMGRDPKLKEYAADLAQIQARMNACVEHQTRVIDQIEPDLSLPLPKEPPAMVRVRRVTVRSDKADEFIALIKSDLMPYVKQSHVSLYTVARVRFGGPSNEFITSSGLSSWADLDDLPPFIKLMGEAKYKAYMAKSNALITQSEVNVYSRQPELCYDPAPTASARN